jgi:hypothetical protein
MRLSRAFCPVFLLPFLLFMGTHRSHAQRVIYGQGWTIPDPIIVNIYWDNNWDSNMAGSPLASRAAIDAWTRAMCDGSYFSGLGEYGIHRCEFRGSFTTSGASPAPRVGIANFQELLRSLLTNPPQGFPPPGVDLDRDAQRVVYNIFASRSSADVDIAAQAYHFFIAPTPGQPHFVAFTALFPANSPTSTTCASQVIEGTSGFGTITTLTENLTHEITEAVTDPGIGPGWWNVNVTKPPLASSPLNGEIADLSATSRQFLFGCTEDFWSQRGTSVISGYPNTTLPQITAITPHGSGRNTSLTIEGSGFGAAPRELLNGPFTGKTAFLSIQDSVTGVTAGHLLSQVNATYAGWSDSRIVIEGIASDNVSLRNGFSVQLFSTFNGQASSQTVAPAVATSIHMAPLNEPYPAGPLPLSIVGTVADQYQNSFGPVTLHWSSDSGAFGSVTASGGGTFVVSYPMRHAGLQTITFTVDGTLAKAQIDLQVLPTITEISPDHGTVDAMNAPVITITGFGLDTRAAIQFLNRPATVTGAGSTPTGEWIKVTQPASPIPGNRTGWVDVVAVTQGLESRRNAFDLFAFYRPGVPLLLPGPESLQCGQAKVEAIVWDASGAAWTDNSTLSHFRLRTNHGSLAASGPAQTDIPLPALNGGMIAATLYESQPGNWADQVSVMVPVRGPIMEAVSEETVTINNTVCDIIGRQGEIGRLAGRVDIRGALKDWVRPRVPAGQLAGYTRPFTATIATTVRAAGSSAGEVRVEVKDATGKPVAGMPFLFMTSNGLLGSSSPLLTDARGVAKTSLKMAKPGAARVRAIAADLPGSLIVPYVAAKKLSK